MIQRFPTARAVATAPVIESLIEGMSRSKEIWGRWFGDRLIASTGEPDTLEGSRIKVDAFDIDIVQLKQADISPTTAAHIPELGLVVAGDAAYNEIHATLGASDLRGQ